MKSWMFTAAALGLGVIAPTGSANLVISEVLYNELGSDRDGEFIEIYNNGSVAIDLSNYKIGDEETSGSNGQTEGMFQFPTDSMIAPGEVQIVGMRAGLFFEQYGFNPNYEIITVADSDLVPDMTVYTPWDPDGGLINMSNSLDHVLLLDGSDALIDALSWGSNFAFNPGLDGGAESDGQSWTRKNATIDTDTADDWELSGPPSDAGSFYTNSVSPGIVTIPEPASLVLLGLGGLSLLGRRRGA